MFEAAVWRRTFLIDGCAGLPLALVLHVAAAGEVLGGLALRLELHLAQVAAPDAVRVELELLGRPRATRLTTVARVLMRLLLARR